MIAFNSKEQQQKANRFASARFVFFLRKRKLTPALDKLTSQLSEAVDMVTGP